MSFILDKLEWAARYGFIDIAFGLGVTGIIWRGLRRFVPRNLEHLHIHVQPHELHVANDIETYDNALGIFISNAGQHNIYIARAFFRDRYRTIWPLTSRSELPIYPKAFRSAAHDAYEIKFGDGWYEFDCLIKPGHRTFTYLPLSKPPDETTIAGHRCGTIILEYATAGRSGVHRVRV